jgi:hypothetical protein
MKRKENSERDKRGGGNCGQGEKRNARCGRGREEEGNDDDEQLEGSRR